MPSRSLVEVTLRVRMSAHDAHYAGDLVDGARLLALLGDVATELLVRHDGDEGLFRAYDAVEFLAPVFAGDTIETSGAITEVGRSSRRMRFEARKTSTLSRRLPGREGAAVSAAEPVDPPVVVCRATGTCVVPAGLQRRVRDGADARELVLTAAIVGAELTRDRTPFLPISPDEIAAEAARCREAGAAVVHLHVRNPDGTNTQAAERFAEVMDAIRRRTDVVVQVSTGGAVGMSIDERAGALGCRPEMATLNMGTMNFGDDVFANTRPDIRRLARLVREAGAVPELECYEVGHVHEAIGMAAEGLLAAPLHFQFVLGVPGGIAATEPVLRFLASEAPAGATWAVAAVGRHQQPMTELAMRLGGHARVGIEDNIWLTKGVLAEGSAPLVARAAEYARSIGRVPVEPVRARTMLGIRARA